MGKRGKTKKNIPNKLLPHERAEITELVEQLFRKCTTLISPVAITSKEWENYLQIYQLIEKIQDKEKEIPLPMYNREEQIKPFLQWLDENSVKINGVEIFNFDSQGFGLKATKALTEGELILSIPSKLFLSQQTAVKSYLGSLMKRDPILQHMGNVALSLHVLGEFVNSKSFWLPYLRILPSSFTTTLYFSPEDMKLMKGSPVQDEAVKQFLNIARQYSYFYRIFHSVPEARSWPIRDYFTFDAYRWAVSAVMTRLNKIPSNQSGEGILALIPVWDMANHEDGVFSTDYNNEENAVACFAQRNFIVGEQFKIYYGHRSNSDFFLHNAFVFKDNPNDSLFLKLGVSKGDPLYEKRAKLLNSLSLSPSGVFHLERGMNPISPNLLCFARIFCMDEDSLELWWNKKESSDCLRLKDCDVDSSVEVKALQYLLARISLLSKAYPTHLQEDEASLEKTSDYSHLILSLLVEEKKILKDAVQYLSSRVAV